MEKVVNFIKKVYFVLYPFLILLLFELFFTLVNHSHFQCTFKSGLMGVIIYLCLYSIILGITKKTSKASIIMGIFLLLFGLINQYKIYYTHEPIVLSDVLFLNTGDEIVGLLDGTIGRATLKIMLYWLPYLIVNILIFYLSIKDYRIINKLFERIAMIIVPIIVLIMLFFPSDGMRRFILNIVYDVDNRQDYDCVVNNLHYSMNYGVISAIYVNYLENKIVEPINYDESKIESELSGVKDKDKSFGKPNVIVLFAESFWDIDKQDDVKFNKTVAPNIKKLKDKGIMFDMISPSYGGISANVEFEFLTGANVEYYNNGYIPYMQLYKNDTYYDRPSIIGELENNGYKTKLTAFTSDRLFNCGKVYDYFGIDETRFITDVDKKYKKGGNISDEYVVDLIIDNFENKPKNERDFYMTLSMQTHMPYTKKKYKSYEMSIEKSPYEDNLNDAILAYAESVHDMDKQLGRLYKYIKTLDEPTVVVFFGDHLPYLSSKSVDANDKFSYFNTDDEVLNTYRRYNTQGLILANFDIEEKDYKYAGPDLLSTYLLNRMDIKLSPYYKWLYTNLDVLPASNRFVSVDKKGKVYSTNDLPKSLSDLYNFREGVQYKYFYK